MPPLGEFDSKRGFIPDYAAMLMFDEFVVDGEAVERISSQHPWLGAWPELVHMLADEGVLRIVDVESEAKEVSHRRGVALRRDLRQPERWARAMMYHDALLGNVQRVLGQKPPSSQPIRWKFDVKKAFGYRGKDGDYHALAGCPLVEGEKFAQVDPQLRERALDELAAELREVNAIIALSSKFEAVPMPWAPYAEYLHQKSGDAIDGGSDDIAAARLFFRVTFPRYRPETVRHFQRLRSDKRLRDLRETIRRAVLTGDAVDPQYPQRILEQILSLEQRSNRRRTLLGWLTSAIHLFSPHVVGAAATAAEAGIEAFEHRHHKKFDWFYLISDGRGLS